MGSGIGVDHARHVIRATAAGIVLAALGWSMPAMAQAEFDCVMTPSLVVRLGGPVGGILELVSVERGQEVRKGDLIARLTSSVERETETLLALQAEDDSAITAQEARLAFFDRRLERTRSLAERGVSTQVALDEFQAEVEASRSLLRQATIAQAIARQELVRAQASMALREIRSPIDGLVTEQALSAGEYLQLETHVATIVQLDPIFVETYLPVAVFGSLAVGDKAEIRPAAPVGGSFEASVTVIDRVFDAASGTFGVRLSLPNPELRLPAGHRCTVIFPGLDPD